MYNITLGGKTPEDLGLHLLKGRKVPGAPSTKDYIMDMPGVDGAYDYGSDNKPLPFGIPLGALRKDPASLQKVIRDLKVHIFDAWAQPKTMRLIFGWEPDLYYDVRYSGSLSVERLVNLRMGKLVLPLKAFYPHARFVESVESITLDSDVPLESDVELDDQYTFDIDKPTTVKVNNFGSMIGQPITEIRGRFETLTLTANGRRFSFNEPLRSQVLIIDHARYTVEVNGVNKYGSTNRKFLELPPGEGDVVIDGTDMYFTITFKFKPQYV